MHNMGALNIGFKNGDDVSKSIQSGSQYIVSRLKGRAVKPGDKLVEQWVHLVATRVITALV